MPSKYFETAHDNKPIHLATKRRKVQYDITERANKADNHPLLSHMRVIECAFEGHLLYRALPSLL